MLLFRPMMPSRLFSRQQRCCTFQITQVRKCFSDGYLYGKISVFLYKYASYPLFKEPYFKKWNLAGNCKLRLIYVLRAIIGSNMLMITSMHFYYVIMQEIDSQLGLELRDLHTHQVKSINTINWHDATALITRGKFTLALFDLPWNK